MNNIFTEGRFVHLFSRDDDGKLKEEIDKNLSPYFYIPDENGKYVSIFGDKCSKVVANAPVDVRKMRVNYPKTFEADIHYPHRIMIDIMADNEPAFTEPLRYQFIDIELETDGRPFVNMQALVDNPIMGIASVAIYDSVVGYRVFCQRKGQPYNTELVKCFDDEQDMGDAYADFLKDNFPDVMVGWNASRFDFPYLLRRWGRYTSRWEYASPVTLVNPKFFHKVRFYGYDELETKPRDSKEGDILGKKRWTFGGLSFLDYMDMYKKIVSLAGKGLDSYALDNVGEKELGMRKIPFNTKNTLVAPIEKLIAYNLRDVEIMVKLEEKLGLIRFYNQVRKIANVEFESVMSNSRMIDSLMLHYAKKMGVVLPTKIDNVILENFEGGYNKEPSIGMHEWVAVFDFASLYPNIMRTFNISPETITKDSKNAVYIDGVYFNQTTEGLFPMVCRDFMAARDRVKKEMKKHKIGSTDYMRLEAEYAALKTMTNTIYGYAAYKKSRLFSIDVCSSITYIGRTMIKEIEKRLGITVIYADTDSVFIKLTSKNKEDAMKESESITKKVKKIVDEFVAGFGVEKHLFDMQFDKLYQRLFIGSKKRYVGWLVWKGTDCDNIEYRGYETRRSDAPLLAKKFLNSFFERLMKGATKSELDAMIVKFKEDIRNSPLSEIGIPVTTKHPSSYKKLIPMHARSLQNSIDSGILDENVYGDKVKYIFVTGDGQRTDVDVMSFIDDKDFPPEGYRIDYERVIKRLVDMKIDPIYDVLFAPKLAAL